MNNSENSNGFVNEKIWGAIGLATKARKCLIGTGLCVESMRANKGKLLLIASDVSDNTRKRLVKTAQFHKIPYTFVDSNKGQLSHIVGKSGDCAAILLTDDGFAKIIEKLDVKIHITDTEVLD